MNGCSTVARWLRALFFSAGSLVALAAIAADEAPRRAVHPRNTATAAADPRWHELTPAQQQALAPLAGEWDKLEPHRKSKWLAIGNRYASMTPDEQQRLQERMRDWVRLTPEQRRVARESFARAKKLDREQKSERWEQYQQLPEEQKMKLANDAAARKRVTTLPSPAAQAQAGKPIPPIKSAPKPVLEQSVTPQAARKSALRPIPQAAPQPATQEQH
jgi:hypothetical protein